MGQAGAMGADLYLGEGGRRVPWVLICLREGAGGCPGSELSQARGGGEAGATGANLCLGKGGRRVLISVSGRRRRLQTRGW